MKQLSRRTVLKGVGVSIALPWLDAMEPIKSLLPKNWTAVDEPTAPKRLAFMYCPNGVIGETWFPKTGEERGFELPESLSPLQSCLNQISIFSGLNRTRFLGEPHAQAASCWLTSALPTQREDGATAINTTLDQVVAKQIGNAVPFSSLELSCNSFTNNLEPKIYDAVSWYGPGNDAKAENDPRKVFNRLFGNSGQINRSVLDTVLAQARQLKTDLGQGDRKKLDEYLESIRSIENRLDKQAAKLKQMGPIEMKKPGGIPDNRSEYIRMMGDLMILAFQTDQTRIVTMMVGPERWGTPQMFDGVFDKPVNHHELTHDDQFDEMVSKIDRFHVEQYAYLIDRMRKHREGERTLLDNSFFVLGSGLGDGNAHSYEQLPLIIAGSGGRKVEHGRHIVSPEGTPLANIWLTLAREMGVKLDRFADSTGGLDAFVGTSGAG